MCFMAQKSSLSQFEHCKSTTSEWAACIIWRLNQEITRGRLGRVYHNWVSAVAEIKLQGLTLALAVVGLAVYCCVALHWHHSPQQHQLQNVRIIILLTCCSAENLNFERTRRKWIWCGELENVSIWNQSCRRFIGFILSFHNHGDGPYYVRTTWLIIYT